MHTYHVTYFYLATGMEGHADQRDYGHIDAWSKDEAITKVAKTLCSRKEDIEFAKGCLSARATHYDYTRIKDI